MGDTVGLLPEDYIIFMAKKSGGKSGAYLKLLLSSIASKEPTNTSAGPYTPPWEV